MFSDSFHFKESNISLEKGLVLLMNLSKENGFSKTLWEKKETNVYQNFLLFSTRLSFLSRRDLQGILIHTCLLQIFSDKNRLKFCNNLTHYHTILTFGDSENIVGKGANDFPLPGIPY